MKYIFAIVQVLTLIWLVALAFPQRDSSDDSIIFDNDNDEMSSSTRAPSSTTPPSSTTQGTTDNCPCVATAEYNPVCGTNNVTYWNMGRFNCAKNCNPGLEIRVIRACEPYSQLSSN
ncbi:PREDICTED: uncharacterized protein LOC105452431 [Wasmannia auropunctata]|uniref:uncharacterized protein LOC105452431 n=1 Tax=Wasmannia auropunctata TaxID=64793 RepID=UPI0005F006C8|nr:PREDICTED: uncharacterized protein LOC105452431 [Wasmannia auropunctata]